MQTSLLNIAGRIFTIRFYTQNTGFFFLLFYLFFGVVEGGQLIAYHYGLLLGIVGNTGFLLLALCCWALYNMKCLWFVSGTLSAKEYTFLYQTIGVIPRPRRMRIWLWIHISIYTPALIYGMIAIVVACLERYYGVAVTLVAFNVLMICVPAWGYDYLVKRPGTIFFYQKWQQWFNRYFRKPLTLFYVYELMVNRSRSLLVIKILSCAILLVTFALMKGDTYDVRMVLAGLLIATLLHAVLVFEHRHFEDRYLAFSRNLPLPPWKRYGATAVTYMTLLLPECGLLVLHTLPHNAWHWAMLMAFGISVLLMFRSLLYFPRLDQDKYLRWVFCLFCLLFFMILSHLYGWAILLLQGAAIVLFITRYYRYEPAFEQVQ